MNRSTERHVLQFCHGYDGPFLDCARQYASLFAGTGYKVTTVFLTGAADPDVAAGCASDEVIFMEFSSKAIRGLKLGAIARLRKIAASRLGAAVQDASGAEFNGGGHKGNPGLEARQAWTSGMLIR